MNDSSQSLPQKHAHGHDGHRKRVKDKVKKFGFDPMYDHEVLELLLFYAIPRRDTNQLAHDLINHFGSLRDLMDADVADIENVSGMGESAAILIKTMYEMMLRYIKSADEPIDVYDTFAKVVHYIRVTYLGVKHEVSRALLFDCRMKMLDSVILGEGDRISTEASLTKLIEAIARKKPAAIILVHNHPTGDPTPSLADYQMTQRFFDTLSLMSIVLIEHVIYTERSVHPLMQNSMQYSIEGDCAQKLGEGFYQRFFFSSAVRNW
ncbi:MAG: hypothetical protein J6B77_06095 [Clostridia bacterium]|nr:hypothetical protein [Clostridia bacterium]